MEKKGRIVIFGGTSEGRELAETAQKNQVQVLVSVVSEYGESLLGESKWVGVHQGALDADGMRTLLRTENPPFVLDATHPYAKVVTAQVRSVCEELHFPCYRVLREEEQMEEGMYRVATTEEAVKFLKKQSGNVLLTTGSRELHLFAEEEELLPRLFARVLPDSKVIAQCEEMGVTGSHLIAMQGPFSVEMNEALLHQTQAEWMVTKESGVRGGFQEKWQSAKNCGAKFLVISRPEKEEGISLAQAKQLLEGMAEKTLFLIGMGMGGGEDLTMRAVRSIQQCEVIFGAPRMLRDIEDYTEQLPDVSCIPLFQAAAIEDWLTEQGRCIRTAGVILSGDTGFYSGSSALVERFSKNGWKVKVLAGISSPSALASRMQTSWEGWYLASAHGRKCSAEDLKEMLDHHEKVFLLLGGEGSFLHEICQKLVEVGYGKADVTAGIQMGYPQERLITGRAEDLCQEEIRELAAALIQIKT